MPHRHPIILAHRGASNLAPENTLPAFERAVACGADVLETDVQWTKDGTIVVSHDESVDRMSDGSGRISELTDRQLTQLDFGYRFSVDGGQTHPFRGQGIRLLRFEELLNRFPNARFNVDIKPAAPPSLQSFVRVLYESDAVSRVVVASFHHTVLEQIRQINPQVQTSASRREATAAWLASFGPLRPAPALYTAIQIPNKTGWLTVPTPRLIRFVHACRAQVHVWTVDDPAEMMRLFQMGVDGIVTNCPDIGVQIRNEFLLNSAAAGNTV